MIAPKTAAAGASQALVSSMSDGTARPVIQYGNSVLADPAGKCPTGSNNHPPKKTTSAATGGRHTRNDASDASAKTR